MPFRFCFLNQFFFRGRGKGREGKMNYIKDLSCFPRHIALVIQDSVGLWIDRQIDRQIDNLYLSTVQNSSALWIPRYRFRTPGTGFQYLSVEPGFWIPIVCGIPNSLSCIPDSTQVQDSGFHEQKFIAFPYLGGIYASHCCNLVQSQES